MNDGLSLLFLLILLVLLDLYVYRMVSEYTKDSPAKLAVRATYWLVTALMILGTWKLEFIFLHINVSWLRKALLVVMFANPVVKIILAIYQLVADLWNWFFKGEDADLVEESTSTSEAKMKQMSRKKFLIKSAMAVASLPVVVKGFNIINKAYDYRLRRMQVFLPNLPAAFDGVTIGQISDIHSGSFFNKTAVQGGVDMLMATKPDMIFFTGDLVNSSADEVDEYFSIFRQVKAPLGVHSILGNHDYGDYQTWPSMQAKQQNFNDLLKAHEQLGWDLMRNEQRMLKVDGEQIALIGVENWGAGRFAKYGDLKESYKGAEEAPVKLLLSHDPSHWEAEVLPNFKDIDMTFSGHTHGFQFGIEIGNFQWSPSQYLYRQWAGLYQTGDQFIYVNRGYGFIGLPGRVGISPEVTLIELKKA